jgi:hypothetical protein
MLGLAASGGADGGLTPGRHGRMRGITTTRLRTRAACSPARPRSAFGLGPFWYRPLPWRRR